MSLSFDKLNKIITVNAPDVEITIQELHNQIVEFEDNLINLETSKIVSSGGKEPLGGGVSVGITLTLLNNWQLSFEARTGLQYIQCKVSGGNIVSTHINGAIYPTAFTQVLITASSSATSSDIEAIQYASYGGAVSIDVNSANSGIDYPVGNQEYPVNNLLDAVLIANNKGLNTLFVKSDLIIGDSVNLEHFTIIGESRVYVSITIESSAEVQHIKIKDATLKGVLDGSIEIVGCNIPDGISCINGHIENCGVGGTFTICGVGDVIMVDCYTIDKDKPLIIDMINAEQDLVMPEYTGIVKVINLKNEYNINIGLDQGMVIFDSSITAGTIMVSGTGSVINNSSATTYNDTNLMNNTSIANATWQHSEAINLISSLSDIKEAQLGNWEIINNQLIMKKQNGDLLKTFNLFKASGLPTTEGATKRVGV